MKDDLTRQIETDLNAGLAELRKEGLLPPVNRASASLRQPAILTRQKAMTPARVPTRREKFLPGQIELFA